MIFSKFSAGFCGVLVFPEDDDSSRFSMKMLWWCYRIWKFKMDSAIGVSENTPDKM